MKVFYLSLYVLIATNSSYSYVVENRKSAEDEEKKIVVHSLDKFLNEEQSQSGLQEDESINSDEGLNVDEKKSALVIVPNKSFGYKPSKFVFASDIPSNAKPPFAVPPTDVRYYLEDFTIPPSLEAPRSPMALQIDDDHDAELQKTVPQQGILSSGDDVTVDHVLHKPNYYSFFLLGHGPPRPGVNYEHDNVIVALTYGITGGMIILLMITLHIAVRNVKKKMLDAEKVDYPAYGVTGPSKETPAPTGDRNLAHSAQMYHFHHQKSQIIAMENRESKPSIVRKGTESGSEEDEAVYECPGLAPVTGEMEVNNPLFHEEDVKSSNISNEEKEKKVAAEETKKSKK